MVREAEWDGDEGLGDGGWKEGGGEPPFSSCLVVSPAPSLHPPHGVVVSMPGEAVGAWHSVTASGQVHLCLWPSQTRVSESSSRKASWDHLCLLCGMCSLRAELSDPGGMGEGCWGQGRGPSLFCSPHRNPRSLQGV